MSFRMENVASSPHDWASQAESYRSASKSHPPDHRSDFVRPNRWFVHCAPLAMEGTRVGRLQGDKTTHAMTRLAAVSEFDSTARLDRQR